MKNVIKNIGLAGLVSAMALSGCDDGNQRPKGSTYGSAGVQPQSVSVDPLYEDLESLRQGGDQNAPQGSIDIKDGQLDIKSDDVAYRITSSGFEYNELGNLGFILRVDGEETLTITAEDGKYTVDVLQKRNGAPATVYREFVPNAHAKGEFAIDLEEGRHDIQATFCDTDGNCSSYERDVFVLNSPFEVMDYQDYLENDNDAPVIYNLQGIVDADGRLDKMRLADVEISDEVGRYVSGLSEVTIEAECKKPLKRAVTIGPHTWAYDSLTETASLDESIPMGRYIASMEGNCAVNLRVEDNEGNSGYETVAFKN